MKNIRFWIAFGSNEWRTDCDLTPLPLDHNFWSEGRRQSRRWRRRWTQTKIMLFSIFYFDCDDNDDLYIAHQQHQQQPHAEPTEENKKESSIHSPRSFHFFNTHIYIYCAFVRFGLRFGSNILFSFFSSTFRHSYKTRRISCLHRIYAYLTLSYVECSFLTLMVSTLAHNFFLRKHTLQAGRQPASRRLRCRCSIVDVDFG